MAKKLSLLLAAIAVVALAVPAFASASELTDNEGNPLPVETRITGTSHNTVTHTDLGLLECATVTVFGEVTENGAGSVHGVQTGTPQTTECFSEGAPLTITNPTLLTIESSTSGSGIAGLTFEADLPIGITCHYEGNNVPFTYTPGTDSLKLAGPLSSSPEICGAAEITGDFTLTQTSNGSPVILD